MTSVLLTMFRKLQRKLSDPLLHREPEVKGVHRSSKSLFFEKRYQRYEEAEVHHLLARQREAYVSDSGEFADLPGVLRKDKNRRL